MTLALARREKMVLAAGAAFVFLFLFYQVGVGRAVGYRERLSKRIDREMKDRDRIVDLAAQYVALSERQAGASSRFSARPPDFKLFTFLDRLAGEAGIKPAIQYMKPSVSPLAGSPYKSSTVEMKLSGLSMEQFFNFLYRIESSGSGVSVRRMALSVTGKDERYLEVVLQASTLEK